MSFSPDHDPLREFFSEYPTFIYNPDASATSEFHRMCNWFDWDRGDSDREEAYDSFRDAITKQFNLKYGTDASSLASWQLLCDRLQVFPIPDTLKECREIVMGTHVNLVDLVDDGVATVFTSVEQLSNYTKSSGKYFPRENLHAGDLLKCLLRHILDPSKDSGRTQNRTRGRGRGRGNGGGNGNGSRGRGRRGRGSRRPI